MSTERPLPLHTLAEALARQPAASMEQLAQAIGVSRATLHRMVSSRDELINTLEQYAYDTCSRALDTINLEQGSTVDALRRLIRELHPHAALFLFLQRHAYTRGYDRLKQNWSQQRELLVQFFRRGQDAGEFRADVSAQWLVDVTAALLQAAADAAHDERLARADVEYAVTAVLLEGVVRRPDIGA